MQEVVVKSKKPKPPILRFKPVYVSTEIPNIIEVMPTIKELIDAGKEFCTNNWITYYEGGSYGNFGFRDKRKLDQRTYNKVIRIMRKYGISESKFNLRNIWIVTATQTDMGNLSPDDFVKVYLLDPETQLAIISGKRKQTSEIAVYTEHGKHTKYDILLHGHFQIGESRPFLDNAAQLEIPMTSRDIENGTLELSGLVQAEISPKDPKFFLLNNHGFFSAGNTVEQARQNVRDVYEEYKKLSLAA